MRRSKGFTLIELVVVIAVIAILIGMATVGYKGYTKEATLTRIQSDIKVLESASEQYYMKEGKWPRGEQPYTSEEVTSDSKKVYDKRGMVVELDPEGTYYDINHEGLNKYVKITKDREKYIIQNPVGDVYYVGSLKVTRPEVPGGTPNDTEEDLPIITILPYNLEPTNESVTVTATTDKGTLNQDSHTFEDNGSFEFIATYEGKETKETVTITNINKELPIITIDPYNTEPTNESITVTATTDKGTLNQDTYIFESNSSFEFIATDEYGNIAKETVTITNIDKDFPIITINPYNTNPTNQNIIVTATTDKGTLNQDSYTFTGNESFEFIATDLLGNTTRQTVTITNINKELPVITINPYNTNPTNQNITVTVTTSKGTLNKESHIFTSNSSFEFIATDEYGNISKKLVTINNISKDLPVITINPYNTNPTNQNIIVTATTNKGTLNKDSHTFTGNSSFEFIATDSFGNISKKTVTITNIDKVAPTAPTMKKSTTSTVATLNVTITYSADSVKKQYKIGNGAWLNYTTPVVIDEVCTVYARAEDSVGNVSENEILISNIINYDSDYSGTTNGNFKYIGSATTVTIPHKIKGVAVTSYKGMFQGSSVKTVISTNPNITDMSNMFYDARSTTLNISGIDTSNVTNMNGMLGSSLATTITGLTTLDTSNVTDMGYMLSYSKIKTLNLSSFNTSKVTNMGGMFAYSESTSIDMSSFNTSNVTAMNRMFTASKVPNLNLTNFDTSKVTDMSYMFFDNYNTSIDISSFNTSNVTNMEQMFFNSKLTTLNILNFNTSKVTNMYNMFANCRVTTLDLSSFNTSNVTNMGRMFADSYATKGYARTTTDRNNFNASTQKPATLNFTLK